MKKWLTILFLQHIAFIAFTQVTEMNWQLDYQIYMKMANDSTYKYDIRDAFHINSTDSHDFSTEFVFYPVNPGGDYALELADKIENSVSYKTLWSAMHAKVGGGWIHFTNCISYALETQTLNLHEPIMVRPKSTWKPNPVTDSWKITHNWASYIPLDQKSAIKEYKRRLAENTLGDLSNLPVSYFELLINTSEKEYKAMKEHNEYNTIAKIDLVKVLLGANYLGEEQITYISNAVLNSVKNYTATKLPSILIFDEYNAAAAMSLEASGYKIQQLAFKESTSLTSVQIDDLTQKIYGIIENINAYNQVAFKKQLGTYYQK